MSNISDPISLSLHDSVGLPVTGQVSFVLAIDWFNDRLQTAVNIVGDAVGAAVLHHTTHKRGFGDELLANDSLQASVALDEEELL